MSRRSRPSNTSDGRRAGRLQDWDATPRGIPNGHDRRQESTTSYESQWTRSIPADFPLPIEGQRRSYNNGPNSNASSRTRPRAALDHHAAGSSSTPSLPHPSGSRGGLGREEQRANQRWSALPNQLQGVGLYTRTPHRNSNYISAPPILRGPGRKAASSAPLMWNPSNEPQSLSISRMTATPKRRPPIEIVKSTQSPKPLWQHQDDEYEAQQKIERRMEKRGELGNYAVPPKRSSAQPRRAYLNPALQVIQDPLFEDNGKDDEGMEEHRMEVDQPPRNNVGYKLGGVRTIPKRTLDLANKKAARKLKWSAPPKEDSDPESSPPSSSASSSSDSVVELTDDENDSEKEHANEEEATKSRTPEDEILIVEPPQPVITIPLPQITPVVPQPLLTAREPPESLVTALAEFCLPSTRMQKTKQLPFLLRNLRRGFRIRCNSINIKTGKARLKMPVVVRYEYAESIFEVQMEKWLCPICELHGAFPNKEMLRCHFQWDHPEVILERWEQRTNNLGKAEWSMHIMIPEVTYESIPPREYDLNVKLEPREISIESDTSRTISTRSPSHVSTVTHETTSEPPESRDITPNLDSKQDLFRKIALKKMYAQGGRRLTSITPSSHRSQSTFTNITDQTEESLSTVRVEHTPGPPGGQYPSPPPVHDPLGPAAQYPYLPAKSEYGGPDIHYSCRPGGPSTFDLLSTLPLEPFGVLEWEILEREEEIYESDDVKVEYKVMHALWSRWISLHRSSFVENYYKGVTAFIDEYWRMIHQAAGWKAMRYWLLGLFAHRYLTIRDVARALKHYERLTGMSLW